MLPENDVCIKIMGNSKKEQAVLPGPDFRPHPDVVAQNMGDSTFLLLHLETGHFYELNKTATRFWELLTEGKDLEQIQKQLLLEYDVRPTHLKKEFARTLASMKKKKLIVGDE